MTINFRQQLVAVVATVLVSTACLVGAVGPAAVNGPGARRRIARDLMIMDQIEPRSGPACPCWASRAGWNGPDHRPGSGATSP